jgi:hypothetical protein
VYLAAAMWIVVSAVLCFEITQFVIRMTIR